MREDIKNILHDETAILARIEALAREITTHYRGRDLTVLALLNGAFIFAADLIRRIPLPLQVDGWGVASYEGTESTGEIVFRQEKISDLRGRDVLVIDDILDTGRTLEAVRARLAGSGAASVRVCVLLRKRIEAARRTDAEFVGFDIPNEFVVGYGLDYNERYRNLPFIGVLTDEAIRRGASS